MALEKIFYRQGLTGSSRHHFYLLKPPCMRKYIKVKSGSMWIDIGNTYIIMG